MRTLVASKNEIEIAAVADALGQLDYEPEVDPAPYNIDSGVARSTVMYKDDRRRIYF